MLKKTLGAVGAALLGVSLLTTGALAQDASPAAEAECAVTTPAENAQIVQSYFDAVMAGDAETADALLSDDYEHDLSTDLVEVPNESGNADELENIDAAADANFAVERMIAQDDWVAVEMHFDITGADLEMEGVDAEAVGTVDVMAFVRIECGMIAETHFAIDAFGALAMMGFEIAAPGE